MPNLLTVILSLIRFPKIDIQNLSSWNNIANSRGAPLELYIKDAFCESFHLENLDKIKRHEEVFSYLGSDSISPDLIIKDGDAIEIKKITTSFSQELQLNSSYPKAKLQADSFKGNCLESKAWDTKDLIYAIGRVNKNKLQSLSFIYGDCFLAERSIYTKIHVRITSLLESLKKEYPSQTVELGRLNSVDPLQITKLRIRSMWMIKNPNSIFKNWGLYDSKAKFQLISLIRIEKFLSFPEVDRNKLIDLKLDHYYIKDVEIPNPDNPQQLMQAKLIVFNYY